MRRIVLLAVLAVGACATPTPDDRVFAVFFTDFSADLDVPAAAVVAQAAAVSHRHPGRPLHVTGYADATDNSDAVGLSRRRADAVSAQLQADGVPATLIEVSAAGSPPNSQPGIERRRVEIDLDLP